MRPPATARPEESATAPAAAPLTELRTGDHARLMAIDLLKRDGEILAALGLTTGCRLRVCRAGDPWIVQVRSTRIGLADAVARQLQVLLDP